MSRVGLAQGDGTARSRSRQEEVRGWTRRGAIAFEPAPCDPSKVAGFDCDGPSTSVEADHFVAGERRADDLERSSERRYGAATRSSSGLRSAFGPAARRISAELTVLDLERPSGEKQHGPARGHRTGASSGDAAVAKCQSDEGEVAAGGDLEETKGCGILGSAGQGVRSLDDRTGPGLDDDRARNLRQAARAALNRRGNGSGQDDIGAQDECVGAGAGGAAADRGVAIGRQDGVREAAGRAVDRDDRGLDTARGEKTGNKKRQKIRAASRPVILILPATASCDSSFQSTPPKLPPPRSRLYDSPCSCRWTCGWAW